MENITHIFDNIEPDWITRRFQEHIKGSFQGSLGMEFIKLEQGHCITCTQIRPEVKNHLDSLHGGFLYTIADSTGGFAAVPLGTGTTVTTVDGHMQFLRPTVGVERLYAEARAIKTGKRITFVDIQLYDEKGTYLAKGSFTFTQLNLPNATMPIFDINNLPE